MRIFFTATLLLFMVNVFGQSAADTAISRMSPLRSMPYEQYKAYLDGEDRDHLGLVAEVNHFPSPQKALDLKKELILTNVQVSALNVVNTELTRKMKEMGSMIVKNETTLNTLFKAKKLDDGTLIFYVNRYGLYQGELRNAILQSYIKAAAILTPQQNKKYQQLQKP
jgi:Spy/CpxP family protein refolding chaperone